MNTLKFLKAKLFYIVIALLFLAVALNAFGVIGLGTINIGNLPFFGQKDSPRSDQPSPVPITIKTKPVDCLVAVKHHTVGKSYSGSGIIVTRKGMTFVLTSAMIFPKEVGNIVVTKRDGRTWVASLIAHDKVRGLAALRIYEADKEPSVELSALNLLTGVEVLVRNEYGKHEMKVARYLHKEYRWLILNGRLPDNCCGAPVVMDDDVVGIIVGINQSNEEQAIAVSMSAIRGFADNITHVEVK